MDIHKYILICIIVLLGTYCSPLRTGIKYSAIEVTLKDNIDTTFIMTNPIASIYLDKRDVLNIAEKNPSKQNLELINFINENEVIQLSLPRNSYDVGSDIQQSAFYIMFSLVRKGKARIFNSSYNKFEEKISYIRTQDLSGQQEHLAIIDGDIFCTKVVSIGE